VFFKSLLQSIGLVALHAVVLALVALSAFYSMSLAHWWPLALALLTLLPVEVALLRSRTGNRGFRIRIAIGKE
jgi:hypothetical protein